MADDGFLEHDIDLEELGTNIRDKVDDIVEYLDYCRSRAAIIGMRASQLSAKAGHFANRASRLEDDVEKLMERGKIKKLPGKFWRFITRTSTSVVPKIDKASALLKLKYRDFVSVKSSYSWDKATLKKALDAKDPKAMEVASLVTKENLNIAPLTE